MITPFFQYQVKTEAPLSVFDPQFFESAWHQPWSVPLQAAASVALMPTVAYAPFVAFAPETITVDKWFHLLSEPIRFPPDLGAPRQQAFFAEPRGMTQPEAVLYSKFAYQWSEPVRTAPRLATGLHPVLAFQPMPSPFVATGWYAPWRDPVRTPPRLPEGEQRPHFLHPNPVVSFSWNQRLSEPVRFPPRLMVGLELFNSLPTPVLPSPLSLLEGWYNWWSEPVRLPIGLKSYLQQTVAMPPRLLPPIAVTGTLNTAESGDLFLAGGQSWNQIASAQVGVIEIVPRSASVGVIETQPLSANVGQIGNIASQQSGVTLSSSYSAIVSIRTT